MLRNDQLFLLARKVCDGSCGLKRLPDEQNSDTQNAAGCPCWLNIAEIARKSRQSFIVSSVWFCSYPCGPSVILVMTNSKCPARSPTGTPPDAARFSPLMTAMPCLAYFHMLCVVQGVISFRSRARGDMMHGLASTKARASRPQPLFGVTHGDERVAKRIE